MYKQYNLFLEDNGLQQVSAKSSVTRMNKLIQEVAYLQAKIVVTH